MITIAGAGVAGLACAYELAKAGHPVRVYDRAASPDHTPCSRFAGGMLAPWCEGEVADPQVVRLGQGVADWWGAVTKVTRKGTLVVAPPRDRAELDRFARRTQRHRRVNEVEIAQLEPDLAGRFRQGLFFAEEAHIDPRQALMDLGQAVCDLGGEVLFGTEAPEKIDVDCRGIAAALPGLRPIRGEMAVIEAPEVQITRTLRLLHPRIPLYLVPRGQGIYMIGATMIESSSERPISVRSMLELLGAAFALHPALGEASVIESGVGLRPAYADNIPRLSRQGDTFHVNGMYRHGFLMAPALAADLAAQFDQDRTDENHRKCRTA